MTAPSPTAPAPKMTTDVEASGLTRLRTAPAPVWTPHASGAATSHGRSSLLRTTLGSRTSACVAQDDCPRYAPETVAPSLSLMVADPSERVPCNAMVDVCGQTLTRPDRHVSHSPQNAWLMMT